ncbi:MAG TPA: YkgJ family cysteine cluster protein [Polyangiaceae bacterium]|nr:YkgJ family cysteine cluster protein [Polyangiaceae bacterium]
MATPRSITYRYQDPLDLIWLHAATQLGIRVERSEQVYASWDGEQTLTLAATSDFDPDDSLAQLIFHELCHALVAGPAAWKRPDWGLCNTSARDLVAEHACHRVQAALAQAYGLRDFFAVTTEWRPYWDALPHDPLAPCDDPALPLAQRGMARADRPPWKAPLEAALGATARIAEAVRSAAATDSLWSTTRHRHPSGFMGHTDPSLVCGQCAWSHGEEASLSCRQAESRARADVRVQAQTAACELWEPLRTQAACGSCGACCREGFDRVELVPGEAFADKHPELVDEDRFARFVPRPGKRCLALQGDGQSSAYRCRVYADRPQCCAEFEVSGEACLVARRRAGLSR